VTRWSAEGRSADVAPASAPARFGFAILPRPLLLVDVRRTELVARRGGRGGRRWLDGERIADAVAAADVAAPHNDLAACPGGGGDRRDHPVVVRDVGGEHVEELVGRAVVEREPELWELDPAVEVPPAPAQAHGVARVQRKASGRGSEARGHGSHDDDRRG